MDKRSSQRLNSLRQDSFITPELNQGELLRFFAEVVWCLTSLLPSQGVIWEAIDQHSSRATWEHLTLALSINTYNENSIFQALTKRKYCKFHLFVTY